MSDPLNSLMQLMAEGKFEETIIEAQRLLDESPSLLDTGSYLYSIGCAKSELDDVIGAIPFFLEALSTLPTTETLLIAHVQDELARAQFNLKNFNSALFFIQMAISNFELGGNAEMKASCEALREEILWQT
jgi:tetratricopeptide (TPR) repeat protein